MNNCSNESNNHTNHNGTGFLIVVVLYILLAIIINSRSNMFY